MLQPHHEPAVLLLDRRRQLIGLCRAGQRSLPAIFAIKPLLLALCTVGSSAEAFSHPGYVHRTRTRSERFVLPSIQDLVHEERLSAARRHRRPATFRIGSLTSWSVAIPPIKGRSARTLSRRQLPSSGERRLYHTPKCEFCREFLGELRHSVRSRLSHV